VRAGGESREHVAARIVGQSRETEGGDFDARAFKEIAGSDVRDIAGESGGVRG
jgi:hypothetical protein